MNSTTSNERAYYYIARVSDPSQVTALPAQKLKLQEYAKIKGFPWKEEFYHEFDESAHKDERAKFEKLVESIAKEKHPCIVVFDKIDRFTRDGSQQVVRTMDKLVQKGRVELHFPSDGGLIIDQKSSAAQLMHLGLGMLLSKYYADSIRDNTRRKQDELCSKGQALSGVPLGYANIDLGDWQPAKRHSWVVVDEDRRRYIIKMFHLRLQGYSYKVISDMLYTDGLRSRSGGRVYHAAIARYLSTPFYCGFINYKTRGMFYPNTRQHPYERLIDRATFDKVQELCRPDLTGVPPKAKEYALKRLVRCKHCGCLMTPYTVKGHVYLTCNAKSPDCPNRNIAASLLAPHIELTIDSLSIPTDKLSALLRNLKHRYRDDEDYQENTLQQAQVAYRDADKSLTDLALKLVDHSITQDIYDRTEPILRQRMQEANEKVRNAEASNQASLPTESYLLSLLNRVSELYASASERLKQKLLKILFSNFVISGKDVEIIISDLCKAFIKLKEEAPFWGPLPNTRTTWGE